ncbi:glycine cleavage system H protein [Rhodococcus sp. 27YEA15]|uniref:glycine cleavage system protein GcvH n=1 Tax=Rhodococcus sp. 27YEA15 TaxID=3156259 RepID=UPI003C7CE204
MSELETPNDLRYTAEHEWVKRIGPTAVRVGITDFAQSQLGDVVFVQLPAVGDDVAAGESLGEVESTKSVSDIFAPLTAKVLAANGELDGQPELVNTAPYGNGWLVELEVSDESALDAALADTLDSAAYTALTSD